MTVVVGGVGSIAGTVCAAVGIGTTLLPYCDFVIVADDARLRLPFVPLGVVPEAGSSVTIPMVLGRQQASYLLLTGEWLDAEGAVAAGLALRCVPRDATLGASRCWQPGQTSNSKKLRPSFSQRERLKGERFPARLNDPERGSNL